MVLGYQPLTPIDVVQRNIDHSCLAMHKLACERMEILQEACDSLELAIKHMEHYVNLN